MRAVIVIAREPEECTDPIVLLRCFMVDGEVAYLERSSLDIVNNEVPDRVVPRERNAVEGKHHVGDEGERETRKRIRRKKLVQNRRMIQRMERRDCHIHIFVMIS